MPFGYSGNTFQTLSPGENDVSSADELDPLCRKFQHVRETVLMAMLLMLAFLLTLVEAMTCLKIITETLGKNKLITVHRPSLGSRRHICYPNSRQRGLKEVLHF